MNNSLNHDRWFTGISLIVLGIVIGVALTANFELTPEGTADKRTYTVPDGSKYFQDPEYTSAAAPPAMDSVLIPAAYAFNRVFIDAAKNVIPAVVSVRNDMAITLSKKNGRWYHFWEDDEEANKPPEEGENDERRIFPRGLGSGVLISDDGYIMTNHHVVENNSEITVIFDDATEFRAEVVGSDLDTDIALLKIDTSNLRYARIGNSNDVEVGEWVMAIGTPFRQSLNSTVTSGIVSAKGRDINILRSRSNSSVEYFIQTDAVINPGNSGGPLINLKGEVVGINTAILSNTGKYQGYGFAVPINLAMHVVEDLKKYGRVLRGFLGVNIANVSYQKLQEMNSKVKGGVEIVRLLKGGPAGDAGLIQGDIIISIDDQSVTRSNELQNIVLARKPGDQIRVEILRDGESKIYWITLREMDLSENRTVSDR